MPCAGRGTLIEGLEDESLVVRLAAVHAVRAIAIQVRQSPQSSGSYSQLIRLKKANAEIVSDVVFHRYLYGKMNLIS